MLKVLNIKNICLRQCFTNKCKKKLFHVKIIEIKRGTIYRTSSQKCT